jgi:hypothetical protein
VTTLAVTCIVAASVAAAQPPGAVDCKAWTECRQLALDAAARQDFETFHDLAWRAVQLGPRNDPALLFVLARAQSLSGRPHDALVMLRRIASSGMAREAVDSPEFARVRTLQGWPEVHAQLAPKSDDLAPLAPSAPAPAGGVTRDPTLPPAVPSKPEAGVRPTAPATAPDPAAASATPAGAPEPLVFEAASFKPAALAYDAVSRRFIIGDTDVSRLAVVDEFSRHVATLASGRSAGFGAVTAIEIDPREGDLWVASVDGSSGEQVPSLHRLQLISGRVLKKVVAAGDAKTPTDRFADIAVAPDGTVYAIQADGSIWRLPPGASSLQLVTRVKGGPVASAAVSSQGGVYVARAGSLLRLRPLPSTEVAAARDVDLSGLVRIRWSQGSLIGVQRSPDGSYRVVRVRLGRDGRAATSLDVLDQSVRMPNPAAATLARGVFYYVSATDGAQLAIRKLPVR